MTEFEENLSREQAKLDYLLTRKNHIDFWTAGSIRW